jgi:hypothetical protein
VSLLDAIPGGAVAAVIAGITAVGALGTAAAGLVDATKAFWGGVSNFGFKKIETALAAFNGPLVGAQPNWRNTVRANWINGITKTDQKAAVKTLIRLGLSRNNAKAAAAPGKVDPQSLQDAVAAMTAGAVLSPAQISLLGRFNDEVDAMLDGAFEEADQQYRNMSKLLAGILAVVLAVFAGWLMSPRASYQDILSYPAFGLAVLIGVISVPLAPVVKDLTSSLQAAATTMKATKP